MCLFFYFKHFYYNVAVCYDMSNVFEKIFKVTESSTLKNRRTSD